MIGVFSDAFAGRQRGCTFRAILIPAERFPVNPVLTLQ